VNDSDHRRIWLSSLHATTRRRDDATTRRRAPNAARRHASPQYPQLNQFQKNKSVTTIRKAASFTVTLAIMSLMASRARGELHDTSPVASLQAAQPLRMEFAARASLMSAPFFLLLPIGISGRASFRSSTRAEKRSIVTFGDGDVLCLGARCAPRIGSALVLEAGAAEKKGSTTAVESIGIGKAALKLFASPMPKRTESYAFGLSPMFACGGGGLEMRLAWW
jgi:hypothetical protein